jgi:hypothetical protein
MKSFFPVMSLAVVFTARSLGQPAMTVGSPAITVAPSFVPGSPVLGATPQSPSAVDTNATVAALSEALLILQTNVQYTLPLLAYFNDNFDLFSFNDNNVTGNVPPPNMSQNLATNFASNLAVNTAVTTGPPLITTPVNRTTPQSAAGITGVPGFASLPMSRDKLRALLILQSDMERLLPLLNEVNQGALNNQGLGLSTNPNPNLFGSVPASR